MQIGDKVIVSDDIYQLDNEFVMINDESYITSTMINGFKNVLPSGIQGQIVKFNQETDELSIQFTNGFLFEVNQFYDDSTLEEFGFILLNEENS